MFEKKCAFFYNKITKTLGAVSEGVRDSKRSRRAFKTLALIGQGCPGLSNRAADWLSGHLKRLWPLKEPLRS